jgi:RNA polymerase sigma factor (sigma-70 family)
MTNKSNQTSDIELVLHTIGYNVTAYEQLYNRYSAIIYSLIRKIIADPIIAQNTLLKVFTVFLKRIEYYDTSKDNVFTWLMLLTRNISLDVLKRLKPVNNDITYDDKYEIEIIVPKLSSAITPIAFDESSEKIKSYKNQLTEVQNLIFSHVFFSGQNDEEIAKKLNIPAVTIKEKILITMESLMQIYREQEKHDSSRKEIIDLIKLDVLGCLSEEEKKHFNSLKQSIPDFPWTELGDYQNLMALISTSLPIEKPPVELSGKINNILVNIAQGKSYEADAVVKPNITKQPQTVNKVSAEDPKKTNHDFAIKFKDPAQNPLFIFKKQEPQNKSQKFISPLSKAENNIKIMDRKPETNIHSNFIGQKENQQVSAKDENTVQTKILQPTSARLNINTMPNKSSDLKREVQQVSVKNDNVTQAKSIQSTSDRININSKLNPPSDFKKEVQQVPAKNEKIAQAKSLQPNSDRFNIKSTPDDSSTLNKEIQPVPEKNDKVLQSKSIQSTSDKLNIGSKSNEPPNTKKETQQATTNDEKAVQSKKILAKTDTTNIKQPADKSTTSLNEKKLVNTKKSEPNVSAEAVIQKTKTKDSININEIISRIEDQNSIDAVSEEVAPEDDEVNLLKKKLKRNFYMSAALIIFLIISSTFIYLNFNSTSDKPIKKHSNLANADINKTNTPEVTSDPQVMAETNDTRKQESITDPKQMESGQNNIPLHLPLVDSSLSGNNIVAETKNDSNLAALNNVQLSNKPTVMVEKKLIAASLSDINQVKEDPTIFVAVEEQPQLIGGLQGVTNKIFYPELANKLGIEGKVIVQAIVDENGNVSSVKTIKGIGGGCDEIAMDAIKDSKFIPGKQKGNPVKVQITIPIVFKR